MLFSRVDVVSTGQTLGKPWPGLSLWIQYLPIKVRSDRKRYVFLKHLSSQLPYISARFSHCSPVQLPTSTEPTRAYAGGRWAAVLRGLSKLQTQYTFCSVLKGRQKCYEIYRFFLQELLNSPCNGFIFHNFLHKKPTNIFLGIPEKYACCAVTSSQTKNDISKVTSPRNAISTNLTPQTTCNLEISFPLPHFPAVMLWPGPWGASTLFLDSINLTNIIKFGYCQLSLLRACDLN